MSAPNHAPAVHRIITAARSSHAHYPNAANFTSALEPAGSS
jgi:hypothetical protein